jgi:phosphopantothenoylcysteine decarboxylase/phosphopantothenate--cysteine ligase
MTTDPSSGATGREASGVHVALGVSGGIGAYKAAMIIRDLRTAGVEVTVLMTANAARFITPLTLQTLSGNRVLLDQFDGASREWDVEHVSLAKRAACLLVAPATANIIGKFAGGIADDFLSTFHTAFDGPVYLAPAMNTVMYRHPAVQANLETLRSRGVRVIEPGSGFLACGDTGPGRLAEPHDIVERVLGDLLDDVDSRLLRGYRVLVTAGPTREDIDPVRFLTNRSSGRMGHALARQAARLGAEVTLVSGARGLEAPAGVELVRVDRCAEMERAVLAAFDETDLLLMAAAPADYRPSVTASTKLSKGEGPMKLELERTTDILAEAGRRKARQVLVGFAAETDGDLESRALEKLRRKNLDLILANRVGPDDRGFGAATNTGVLLDAAGGREEIALMTKDRMALAILKRAGVLLDERTEGERGTER